MPVLLLAGGLRLWQLDAGWFGADQARDISWATQIATGEDFPAAGPQMRNRLRLGAGYYWFWALPHFLSTAPVAAYVFAGVLGVAAVATTLLLAGEIGGAVSALVAGVWLATGPIAVIDSRVAWAPAVLPVYSGLVMWLLLRLQRHSTAVRAAALTAVAACGTQLHLAAAPVALVAGLGVLARARSLGASGIGAALGAGALPLLPMLLALVEPVPAVDVAEALAPDGWFERLVDLLLVRGRPLVGLGPVGGGVWMSWPSLERWVLALELACLVWAYRQAGRAAPWLAAFFVVPLVAVALLPAQTWYYYADTTLVSGAVWVGLAARKLVVEKSGPARVGLSVPALVGIGRVAFLVGWIVHCGNVGFVPTHLGFLRLGAPAEERSDARARVLDVATRTRAARLVRQAVGGRPDAVWRRAHGVGFSDLDTDNGFFFRAAAESPGGSGAGHALVVYEGDFPASWLAGMEEVGRAGPLSVYRYPARLEWSRAQLVNCGGGEPPRLTPRHPRAYGTGAIAYPEWDCETPRVRIPLRSGRATRVFARTSGAGWVTEVTAEGAAVPLVAAAPGVGRGVLAAEDAGWVEVGLRVTGPTALDVYEVGG